MSTKNRFLFDKFKQRSALMVLACLAALPISRIVKGGEPTPASGVATVNVTAVVVPPAPRLIARTAGEAVLIEADLPPTVERFFSLVPIGDGRWTVVLATYDGTVLATYQYPVFIGSLPSPPSPGPQPAPTPPSSELAKVALDAAVATVPADGRKEQAAHGQPLNGEWPGGAWNRAEDLQQELRGGNVEVYCYWDFEGEPGPADHRIVR